MRQSHGRKGILIVMGSTQAHSILILLDWPVKLGREMLKRYIGYKRVFAYELR